MHKISEDNLDQAAKRIRNGEEISSVLSSYPREQRPALLNKLNVVFLASSLPKKTVPQPTRRMLFLEHSKKKISSFMKFMQTLKTSSAIVVAMLILAITGTVSAASHSLPGDKLFALKKVFESAQLGLSTNPESRAQLSLDFANQRLNEAQIVLSQNSDNGAKTKAIEELTQQTQAALNDIKAIAATPSVSKNQDLIQKAENIANGQKDLVAKVDPATAAKNAVQNQIAIADIKRIATAANEQSGTVLPQAPGFDITGEVSAISKDSLTIDNNNYVFDPEMSVIGTANEQITISNIETGDKVHIQGKLSGESNVITKLILISKKQEPQIKAETKIDNKAMIEIPDNNIPAKPHDTFGGFIIEPASSN